MPAFTVKHTGLAKALRTKCGVCEGFPIENLSAGFKHPKLKEYTAIWDTGAEISSISHRVVKELGLTPISRAKNYTAAGEIEVYIYVINITLPMNVGVAMLPVTGNDLGDVDMLIGMDVISQGDFVITNASGKTTFSFRMPSSDYIDYVEKEKQTEEMQRRVDEARKKKRIGRNDPCPCGSGKKFKHCHGKS